MDISGNNRYELLFMDDDGAGAAPAPAAAATKKKTTAPAAPKKPQPTKKPHSNEKENKSSALNKNEGGKKAAAVGGQGSRPQQGPGAGTGTKSRGSAAAEEGGRSVRFRGEQGAVARDQRKERGYGNAAGSGAGGEYSNEQRQPRQFRERDNRGPARNRFGEGGGFRGGKREFDRQSGSDKTGVKAVDKRDGAGAHNWGSVKQEIEDINKSSTDAEATLTDKEESNEQTTEPTAVPVEEEETKEFTLDEWKAMRQQRAKPQFNIRKAGEGEDTSQWKKMVVLNKKKEGGDSEEELEYDPSLYPQRVGRLQRIVDIQFNFNDGRRAGGGFGRGRGRGPRPGGGADRAAAVGEKGAPQRGGGPPAGEPARAPQPGRGGGRNFGDREQRGGPKTLKVDDELQFPTLS